MWWAVVTLTTVGYGDVVPVTPLGKTLGAMITILGLAWRHCLRVFWHPGACQRIESAPWRLENELREKILENDIDISMEVDIIAPW